MIRLFVGLALPEPVALAIARLNDAMPGAHWVEPENLHITLRFIGDVDAGDALDIHHELMRVRAPAFQLSSSGIGTFGQGRKTRALWVGVEKSQGLGLLQGRVDAAVVRAGQPDVTLSRFCNGPADRIQNFIVAKNLFRAGPFDVGHFVLFESEMGAGGSVYHTLESYPLQP